MTLTYVNSKAWSSVLPTPRSLVWTSAFRRPRWRWESRSSSVTLKNSTRSGKGIFPFFLLCSFYPGTSSHFNLLWYLSSSLHSDTRGRKYQQPKSWKPLLSELFCHYIGLDIVVLYLDWIYQKCCSKWNDFGFGCSRESDITKERIQKILASGANVILTTGGIDDMCLKYFVDVGAMAVRRVLKRDLKRIAKATGGKAQVWLYLVGFVFLIV